MLWVPVWWPWQLPASCCARAGNRLCRLNPGAAFSRPYDLSLERVFLAFGIDETECRLLVLEAVHTLEKKPEPHYPAELAVGYRLQSNVFLKLDDPGDLLVQHGQVVVCGDSACGQCFCAVFEPSRPQQAANVFCTERGLVGVMIPLAICRT